LPARACRAITDREREACQGLPFPDTYQQMFCIRAIILLFFCPSRFVKMAVKYDTSREFETNAQLLEKYPDRQLPSDKQKEFTDRAWGRTKKIRRSFGAGFIYVIVALLLGWLSGIIFHRTLGPTSSSVIMALQVLAAGILLGATLSLAGRKIASIGGQTLPEKIDDLLYRILYITGTYLLVLSLSWPVLNR